MQTCRSVNGFRAGKIIGGMLNGFDAICRIKEDVFGFYNPDDEEVGRVIDTPVGYLAVMNTDRYDWQDVVYHGKLSNQVFATLREAGGYLESRLREDLTHREVGTA
jgi:hypothetical protein